MSRPGGKEEHVSEEMVNNVGVGQVAVEEVMPWSAWTSSCGPCLSDADFSTSS